MTDETQADVFAPPRSNVEVREGSEVLWAMTWKEVRRLYMASINIRALGFLYILPVVGIIALMSAMMMTGGPTAADAESLGGWVAALLGIGVVLYAAAAYACFARPAWGRWLGIVLCAVGLLNFPMGTLIGIIGLIAYAQGGKLFGAARIAHKDVVLVYKQRKKDKQ